MTRMAREQWITFAKTLQRAKRVSPIEMVLHQWYLWGSSTRTQGVYRLIRRYTLNTGDAPQEYHDLEGAWWDLVGNGLTAQPFLQVHNNTFRVSPSAAPDHYTFWSTFQCERERRGGADGS